MAAKLCARFVAWSRDANLTPTLRVWLVERSSGDLRIAFRNEFLAPHIGALQFIQADYRSWLGGGRSLPGPSGLRIALVAKVFDLASSMDVDRISTRALP
jgi:hypothetical protein